MCELSRPFVHVTLLIALIGVMLIITTIPVWALTITPDPPTANEPFTISLPSPTTGVLYVTDSPSCVGGSVVFSGFIGPPSFSVSVPGQPAGQYGAFVGTVATCVGFTIVPT